MGADAVPQHWAGSRGGCSFARLRGTVQSACRLCKPRARPRPARRPVPGCSKGARKAYRWWWSSRACAGHGHGLHACASGATRPCGGSWCHPLSAARPGCHDSRMIRSQHDTSHIVLVAGACRSAQKSLEVCRALTVGGSLNTPAIPIQTHSSVYSWCLTLLQEVCIGVRPSCTLTETGTAGK